MVGHEICRSTAQTPWRWVSSRKENKTNSGREKNDSFFPDDATLLITHIVYLIENDPGNFTHNFGPSIEHGAKDLIGVRKIESKRMC